MRRHDFTPYWSQLQVLPRPDGTLEIAHHFDDVREGDEILLGENFAEARRYRVETVSTVTGLQDLWVIRCSRVWPTLHVAGFLLPTFQR